MLNWIKGLFKVDDDPKLKPKAVSEPVYAMLKAWQEDKDRFTFTSRVSIMGRNPNYIDCVAVDTKTGEFFEFSGRPNSNHPHTVIVYVNYAAKFARDKVCICDGVTISRYANWLTKEEVEYLKAEMFPYYQKRVARYRDIIKYRQERRENNSRRNSQIAKDKERKRLMEIYK